MQTLREYQTIPSVSRRGNLYDNASCESFLKTPKREEIRTSEYRDLEHVAAGIGEFIENHYNPRRLHSALGYHSPEEFEQPGELGNGDPAVQAATILGQ